MKQMLGVEMRQTDTRTLASAMRTLAAEVESPDGVANAAMSEAAERLDLLFGMLESIADVLDDCNPDAPGHCHSKQGIWDDDNKPAIAGKPCEWCALWRDIRALMALPPNEPSSPAAEGSPSGARG